MTKKIIFSAGGTGGHIFPAINLMKHFSDKAYKVILVTDNRGTNFLKNYEKFQQYVLKTETPTNKNIIKKVFSYLVIIYSLLKSFNILKKEKPNLIIGFGGYVSFPICFASIFFKIPLIIYENNVVLGRTNKYLSRFSKKIFLAKKNIINLSKKLVNKTYEVGPILDKKIINYSKAERKNNSKYFSILVMGGSQGANIFGEIVPSVIKMISDEGYKIKIIQQSVKDQREFVESYYNKNNIENYVFEFDKNILNLILSSDLAITRCGASATAELTHTQTPFIGVPLKNSIDNHQYLNAKYYENNGCCWILEEKNFNTSNLFNLLIKILKNKDELKKICKNMEENFKKNVYENIENKIKESFSYEN